MRWRASYPLLLLLLLTLIPNAYASPEDSILPYLEIGFNPAHLFKIALGVPIYMPNETLWVRSSIPLTLTLINPKGEEVSSILLEEASPRRLYSFQGGDELGVWTLRVENGGGRIELPLYLKGETLPNATFSQPTFELGRGSILLKGSLSLPKDLHHGGGYLLLVRRGGGSFQKDFFSQSLLINSPLQVQVKVDPDRGGVIELRPFLPNIKELTRLKEMGIEGVEVVTSALVSSWTEIILEVPFIKRVQRMDVVNMVPGICLKTQPVSFNITGDPGEALRIRLPPLHSVGEGGYVPLRSSKGEVRFYLQYKDLIYVVTMPIYPPLLSGREVLEVYPINPLEKVINYTFNILPETLSPFDLFLIIKNDGLEQYWKVQIIPPIAQVVVVDDLTKLYVKDYEISLGEEGLMKDRIGEVTYIRLEEGEVSTGYTLSIEGVRLERGDVKPETISLKPLTQEVVTVALGKVKLEVKDMLGYTPPEGRISIYRVTSKAKLVKEVHWSRAEIPGSITLPLGRYLFEVEVEGVRRKDLVLLQGPETTLSIAFNDIGYPNLLETALILSSLIVIVVEMIYNIRVWLGLFKRRSMGR